MSTQPPPPPSGQQPPTPPQQPTPPPEVHTLKLPFPMQTGETVLLFVRKHWFFFWPIAILWTLYALVPVIAAYILLDLIGIVGDLGIFFWIIALVWVVYWVVRILLSLYRYRNDIWVISNQRVIDSFKANPFNLRVNTADLVNVQDISVNRKGIFATALHYGDVMIATAGTEDKPFLISGVPDPEHIQLLIDKERDRERQRASGGPTSV
jgi:hypothetical protein